MPCAIPHQSMPSKNISTAGRPRTCPASPPTAGRQAFTLPKGGAGSAETQDGKTRVVYVVSQITPAAAATKEETERLSQSLQLQFQRDVQAIYVAALRSRVGVQIDESALKRVSGTEQPQ